MSTIAPTPSEKSVDLVVESTERFRGRALSAAALTGATAAVVASTALEPFAASESVVRLLPLAAAFVFGSSTASFLIAAMLRIEKKTGSSRILTSFRPPWRLRVEPSDEIKGIEKLSWQAKELRKRVTQLMDIGMWLAAAAGVLLAITAIVSVVSYEPQTSVRVTSLTELRVQGCEIGDSFNALVVESTLMTQRLVRLDLEPSACGDKSVSLYLPVTSVQIEVTAPDE